MGGSALVQKQERHLLVVIMCCNMKGREAVLKKRSQTVVLILRRIIILTSPDDKYYILCELPVSTAQRPQEETLKACVNTFPAESGGARRCSRSLATSRLPYLEATWRGVKPFCRQKHPHSSDYVKDKSHHQRKDTHYIL